jgi:hypothetical protein
MAPTERLLRGEITPPEGFGTGIPEPRASSRRQRAKRAKLAPPRAFLSPARRPARAGARA